MPKFEPKFGEFIKDATTMRAENISKGTFLKRDELEKLAKSHNLKKLGHGSELVVFELPKNNYALAVSHRSEGIDPFIAKKRFYIARVLSILFPHNFPKVYTSFGEHPDRQIKNISGSLRQKVEGKHKYDPDEKTFFALLKVKMGIQPEVRFPYEEVRRDANKMGIGIGDEFPYNFILGDDGGEYYVDSPWSVPLEYPRTRAWDFDRIVSFMEEKKYSENDIQKVKNSLDRMQALDKEYAEKHVRPS